MEFIIYHNPRCRKSREALQYLEEEGKTIETVKYLEHSFNPKTLREVLTKIGRKPSEIIRKNESLWKQEYASKNLTEEEILKLLIEHPKLIERPIVIHSDSGVLARPLENLIEFLKKV
jgi:arsenate reductase (glutaredoxin)